MKIAITGLVLKIEGPSFSCKPIFDEEKQSYFEIKGEELFFRFPPFSGVEEGRRHLTP